MNLYDEQGVNLGGGKQGFRVYDDQGHLVGGAGGTGPPGPPGDDGTNGVSIQWLGTFATAPGSPTLNQAYRNSVDKKAYIWDGAAWQEMVEDGLPGSNGVGVTFLGTFATAPSTPSLNQAYRNSVDGKSYIWNGATWLEFAEDGSPGSPGSPGANGGTSYILRASNSSRTIGLGSTVFAFTAAIVTPDLLGWDIGTRVRAMSAANNANFMEGVVTTITLLTLPTRVVSVTVLVDIDGGSGTFSDFVLSVAGVTGPAGATGPGVPTGGTAGQVLSKIDATNYNTQWVTPAPGIDVLQVQVFS